MAVASAGPYASLHLAADRYPRQHPTTQFFSQAGCPSCHPTNSVKALKAKGGIEDRKQKEEGQKITKGRSSRRMEKEQEEVKG